MMRTPKLGDGQTPCLPDKRMNIGFAPWHGFCDLLRIMAFWSRIVQVQRKAQRSLSRWVRGVEFTSRSTQFAGLNVLVVDDDPRNREVLSELLRVHGARPVPCASAAEALQTLTDTGADLILSDLAMPDMDGYDLLRSIRRLPREAGGNTPAVAVSAYGEQVREQAVAAGFQALLPKPVDWSQLVRTVRAVLNIRGS
jgi:CheY-like chemotaxis protein